MDTTQDRLDRALALADVEVTEELRLKAEADVEKAQKYADEATRNAVAAVTHAKKIGAIR